MTLLGLPLWGYLVGLAGLATALFSLHLLRIRLRRQTVDSLLFFQQVGAVHKPRVLPGRPARWLSFALGLALLAAAWTAFAQPRADDDGASRVLVVDTTAAAAAPADAPDGGSVGDALAARAGAIAADAGLGPRGRVIAFGGATARTVWQAGEPTDRIVERLAATPEVGATDAIWTALTDAAHELRGGDEIVVLGGPELLPEEVEGVPVRRAEEPAATAQAAIVAARVTGTSPRAIELEVTTGASPAFLHVRRGDIVLDEAAVPAAAPGATTRATLGPLPDGAATLVVEVEAASGARAAVDVELPERRIVRVHATAGLPDAIALAIEADPRATTVAPSEADVVIATSEAAIPDGVPGLVVVPGVGDAARSPRRLAACPAPLSLRDRARTAPALASRDGEVWVEDAASGAALVARVGDRVRAVSWLLDDPAHRDVPALVLGALHALVPDPPARVGPTTAPAPSGAGAPPTLEGRSTAWPWAPLLLTLALVALAADALLHHRGRVA